MMRSMFVTSLMLVSCAGPSLPADGLRCETRRNRAEMSGWARAGVNGEGNAVEHTYERTELDTSYQRSIRCEEDSVAVDVEWASFTDQGVARDHFQRLSRELTASCTSEVVESVFSPSARPEWPSSQPRPHFSSSLKWAEVVACLEPTERRVLSLSQDLSRESNGQEETTWSVELNRQPPQ